MEKMQRESLEVLSAMRNDGVLCDVTITAGGKTFFAHRNILAVVSGYFRDLFIKLRAVKNGNIIKLVLLFPSVPKKHMCLLLDYAYSGIISDHRSLTLDDAFKIFNYCCHFRMPGMKFQCILFIVSLLRPQNCIGIRKFARARSCKHLEEACTLFIRNHFDLIVSSAGAEEFLKTTSWELKEMISDDDLNTKREQNVLRAIIRWIEYDRESRQKLIYNLMSSMRMGVLPGEEIAKHIEPYVKDSKISRQPPEKCIESMQELARKVFAPRRPHQVLFAVGGWSSEGPTHVIETYDVRADRWLTFFDSAESLRRAYHSVVAIDYKLYLIGGYNGSNFFSNVRCFDLPSRTWTEVAPMNEQRCYISAVLLDGQIYAMGGFNGHSRLNSVERYTPQKNQWELLEPMNYQRSDAGATVVDGEIFVFGGFNGYNCLSNAESYDPKKGIWKTLSRMSRQRSGVGVTSLHGYIYVIGGSNGINRLNTSERYCPVTDSWTTISEMRTRRSNFGISVLDDFIFVFGGFDGFATISSAERYDPRAGKWLACKEMNVQRSGLGTGVVSGLPNRQEYLIPRPDFVSEKLTSCLVHINKFAKQEASLRATPPAEREEDASADSECVIVSRPQEHGDFELHDV